MPAHDHFLSVPYPLSYNVRIRDITFLLAFILQYQKKYLPLQVKAIISVYTYNNKVAL